MTTTNQNTQTGNRYKIIIGGKSIGVCQSISMDENFGLEAVREIGNINAVEHVPTAATYSFSMTNLVLRVGALRALGLIPENGETTLAGVVVDMQVISRDTGKVVRTYQSCSYASGRVDISANRLLSQSSQWMAIRPVGTDL